MKRDIIKVAWVVFSLVAVALPPGAEAHEFWLAPSSFHPVVGNRVELTAVIGLGNEAEVFSRSPNHIKRFLVSDPHGDRSVRGMAYRFPTGAFRVRTEGLQLVAYESEARATSLPCEPFTKYLREEGLEHVIRQREAVGESLDMGRERYSRCAKALVQSGEGGADYPLGLPLEIVAIDRPDRLKAGELMTVQVYWKGRPLEGGLLKGFLLSQDSEAVQCRTDAEGMAKLPLMGTGRWLLNLVHMERMTGDAEADWRSYWASLTFELPEESGIVGEGRVAVNGAPKSGE